MAQTAKLCIYWQGRKSSGSSAPVKRHGVFSRCLPVASVQRALTMVKKIGRQRSGGAALTWESGGMSKTLVTCVGSRCNATISGVKAGFGKGTPKISLLGSRKRKRAR